MKLYLFDEDCIVIFVLPTKKIGNFWMTDSNNKNIINITSENNDWIMTSSNNTTLYSANNEDRVILKPKGYYIIEKDSKKYLIYTDYLTDNSFNSFVVQSKRPISFGKSPSCDISINIPYFLDTHFILTNEDNYWKIQLSDGACVYVNDDKIKTKEYILKNGDLINVYGVKFLLIKNLLFINDMFGIIKYSQNMIKNEFLSPEETTNEEIENKDLYEDKDYFLKSPRMRRSIDTFKLNVDSPPVKENMQETPLIMTLAPMLTMAASSMITLSNAIQSVTSGEKTWKQNMPTLVISITMMLSMLVWPFVTRAYEKRQKIKRENNRQEKYKAYLQKKDEELAKEFANQKRIREENLISLNACYDIIANKRRTLWERKKDQGDFLTVRIGKGNLPFDAQISYHSEDFTMDDDNLKEMLNSVIKKYETLMDVPVGYSFANNRLTAINGLSPKYFDFTKNVLLQFMAFHSYDDLKIVLFTNKKNKKRWSFLQDSPYAFSNEKSIRFIATNTEEMQDISGYLEGIFKGRKELNTNGNSDERITDFSKFNTYYLLIVDDITSARKIDIVDKILEEKANLGFSLVVLEEKLSKIPSEVSKFITIGDKESAVINSENGDQVRFVDEINNQLDMNYVTNILSNVPLHFDKAEKYLPDTITFLEMFGVGQIEQLNILNRWKNNNPVKSLKAEVGVNDNHDLFVLDLHEKYHGPHGLIAGMTGSGKSEFIITYVLSMAINYSPEEVSFVLIDYKGGGLAGAFVNKETGIKLPHVVGTITNLDKSEINRALSSIQSELRRRQTIFNEVRDKLGESTIDIYKYQKLYRDGLIEEPVPHLIIVCDEFAELKDQQPDFMDDLISTARIGRSLGVHLILATQKPSGVVDAQIWSNSKFKVCLKVQDRSDSMEMIKNDLAAELKNVGRFYLQVGYNEYFAMGQAAWAGAQYYPSKEFKKNVDKNLYFIDNTGFINKTINNSLSKTMVKSEGEELTNIVKYLIDISKETEFNIKQLWLEKLSNTIFIKNLYKKYNYKEEKYDINPIIGEYDDPTDQIQGLLTLPITKNGNTIIYGMSDSGKDEIMQSITYSIITQHDSNEVNMYLIDFGSEGLINFADAPQVGDVVLSDEEEKLKNLVKLLSQELNERKKLFIKYGGNYRDYLRLSGNKLPNIIVLINSVEVMNELYMDMIDSFIPVLREGAKYGISFVITTENQSSIKMKAAQTCKQVLTLQLSDESYYKDILGRTEGLLPSNNIGRGLVRLDRVVEFQTAFIDNVENINQTISDTIKLLNQNNMKQARRIPIMPDNIMIQAFIDKYKGVQSIPIGITKESLNPQYYNFKKECATMISSNDIETMIPQINNFVKTLDYNVGFDKIVVDAESIFSEYNYKAKYINSEFDAFMSKLDEINKSELAKDLLVVIVGLDKFYSKLSSESKELFASILKENKETNKISFVCYETPGNCKKYEYEEWFKSNINLNNGIWIGAGLTQQYLLKSQVQSTAYSNIDSNHCIVLKNAVPVIVKLINEIKVSSIDN